MPKAYLIARIDVTDPERYARYTAATPAIAARFGGRFIVRGGRYEAKEGRGARAQRRHRVPRLRQRARLLRRPRLPRRAAARARGVGARDRHRRGRGGSLMPAYWIAHVTVTDAEAYGRYARLAHRRPSQAHGGRFLARGGRYVQLEGHDRARNVVVEFPSLEAAEACYRSPAVPGGAHPRPRRRRARLWSWKGRPDVRERVCNERARLPRSAAAPSAGWRRPSRGIRWWSATSGPARPAAPGPWS